MRSCTSLGGSNVGMAQSSADRASASVSPTVWLGMGQPDWWHWQLGIWKAGGACHWGQLQGERQAFVLSEPGNTSRRRSMPCHSLPPRYSCRFAGWGSVAATCMPMPRMCVARAAIHRRRQRAACAALRSSSQLKHSGQTDRALGERVVGTACRHGKTWLARPPLRAHERPPATGGGAQMVPTTRAAAAAQVVCKVYHCRLACRQFRQALPAGPLC